MEENVSFISKLRKCGCSGRFLSCTHQDAGNEGAERGEVGILVWNASNEGSTKTDL